MRFLVDIDIDTIFDFWNWSISISIRYIDFDIDVDRYRYQLISIDIDRYIVSIFDISTLYLKFLVDIDIDTIFGFSKLVDIDIDTIYRYRYRSINIDFRYIGTTLKTMQSYLKKICRDLTAPVFLSPGFTKLV